MNKLLAFIIALNFIFWGFYGASIALKKCVDTPIYSQELILQASEYFEYDYYAKINVIENIEKLYNKKLNVVLSDSSYATYFGNTIYVTRLEPFILAHEVEHKLLVMREYKANYNAIVRLWESDIDSLRHSASVYARLILNGVYADYDKNYDCTNLLVEYYKESL